MASPVYVAYGIENLILTSADGHAWNVAHKDAASPNCILDMAWNGVSTFVAVGGGGSGNSFFVSTDSGVTWNAVSLGGHNFAFGFGGFDVYPNSGQIVFWDAETSQFIAVGQDTDANLPVVCTSTDGVTWNFQNVAGQTGGQFLCIARGNAIYAAVCWFGGIGGHTTSQIFSSADLITWTSRFTTSDPSSDRQYPWLKYNGTHFLTMSVAGNGHSISSTDGITWTETPSSSAPNLNPFYGIDKEAIWDSTTGLWIATSLGPLSTHGGVFTSSDSNTWNTAYSITNPNGTYAGSVLRAGARLVAFVGGYNSGAAPPEQPHLESFDGITWSPIGSTLDSQYFSVLWDGAQFIGYRLDPLGSADNQIATSPDGSTWTNRYDDAAADILNLAIFGGVIPPPPTNCVDFEIQSPGDEPDSGAQFTCQRLYITANLNVSGTPQVITPTLIIDGVENVLPQITNTGRSTIELPISKYHGRFFDGVRLDGCLTGRIEIFRIEADVWLGEQVQG